MAGKARTANRKARDSVFNDLFTIPKYKYQLFMQLHPEATDIKETDIEIVTLEHVLMNNEYNDLGLLAGDHFLILAEAQSTWSVNILLRFLLYLAATYSDYIDKKKLSLYGSKRVEIPKPELYLIYSGNKGKKPDVLSFSEEFFGGEETAVEVKAKVIYGNSKKKDLLSQYIAYCNVLDKQVKLYGRNKKAVEETIKICSDKNILKEYLEAHRKEVVEIMTQIYNKQRELNIYVAEKERDAEKEAQIKIAEKMIAKDMPDNDIVELTGLALKEVKSLRKAKVRKKR